MDIRSFKNLGCQLLILSLLGNGLAYAAMPTNQYYYQSNQISTVNSPTQQVRFLSVNQDRLVALSLKATQYYLGDGKSQNIVLSQQSDANNGVLRSSVQQVAMDYQGYGKIMSSTVGNVMASFGYNGEYQDSDTRLIDLRAREYDPNTQRFTSMDSYSLWNRYDFADANPVSHIDPNGHSAQHWWHQRPGWQKGLMIGGGVLVLGGLITAGVVRFSGDRQLKRMRKNLTLSRIRNEGTSIGSGSYS